MSHGSHRNGSLPAVVDGGGEDAKAADVAEGEGISSGRLFDDGARSVLTDFRVRGHT